MKSSSGNRKNTGNTERKRIHKLSPVLIDRIAAGEVVDGPYSVVKELVENSIDAGASSVIITTEGGGFNLIAIEDDGLGIPFDDLPASVDRHATSKINDLEDIENIYTFGFRGEALASISAVSHLELRSRNEYEEIGGILESRGGEIVRCEPVAFNRGTTVTVRDLFYSVPARRKFAKSERTENARIQLQIIKIAFAYNDVGFRYIRDGKTLLDLPAGEDLQERISRIYKIPNVEKKLIPIDAESGDLLIHGYISQPGFHKSNREGQFYFVNGRSVEFKNLPFLIKRIYGDQLPPGTNPYVFLFITADPGRIDVNVHPAKKEIRFLDEQLFQALVFRSVTNALRRDEPLTYENVSGSEYMSVNDIIGGKVDRNHDYPESESVSQSSYIRDLITDGNVAPISGSVYEIGSSDQTDFAFEEKQAIDNRASSDGVSSESPGFRKSSFLPRRHFGVIFGTYILAEGEDGLYVIDQHTAHERIHYERIRKDIQQRSGERQVLLHPVAVRVTEDDLLNVMNHAELLEKHGFLVDSISDYEYVVREVPFYVDTGMEEDLISGLIQRIMDGEDDYRIYDEFAAMKACKASIKRNDSVSGEVISEILMELSQAEDPSRCPHGRPTMIRITREELDKMFRR